MTEQKTTYRVDTPMRHNGEIYHPDKDGQNRIELTAKEAKTLLAMKAISDIEEVGQDAPAETKPTVGAAATEGSNAPTDAAERTAAITQAIGQLDKANAEHWLKDGTTPDVKALEGLLGWEITAAERNQAFADLQVKEGGV